MPPKHKRGRPLGSKNKPQKTVPKYGDFVIKSEESKNSIINLNGLLEAEEKTVNQFHCQTCPNKVFKLKVNYENHLLLEHSTLPGSVPCRECNVVCPDNDVLEMHIKKTHLKQFACAHCGREFARHSHVLRHMTQKGCGKSIANYPCEICKSSFSRKDNLLVHLRTMHIKAKAYKCKYCGFNSKNFTKLIRHWHTKHSGSPHTYICDQCGKSTTSRAAMAKHFEIHGEKKYECDVCKYTTHTVEVMRRHVLTHVEDKPYKCDQCRASFIQRSQLMRHTSAKHLGVTCPLCDDKLSTKPELLQHLKDHSIINTCPFPDCPNTKFSNPKKFENHMNSHLDPKKYPCEVCKKTFQSEMNMRRHLSTHTLDKPRRCMYCVSARAYVRGQQLVRHVRRYHPHVFRSHLRHVRSVLEVSAESERVTKSEMECILNVVDAEAERILDGYGGGGVLYGGMQDDAGSGDALCEQHTTPSSPVEEDNPLMSEENLADHLSQLLEQLIDSETLECFGWPNETIDVVLEKVISQCGARAAARHRWSRVARLRENAKQLFLYVVDDKNVARMLDTHTIDQIVKHMLSHFTQDQDD